MPEKDLGSIETGKFADFVMFNTNPLKLPTTWFMLSHKMDLGGLDDFVDLTYVGGRLVSDKRGKRNRPQALDT